MENKCESCEWAGVNTIDLGMPVPVCVLHEDMSQSDNCPGYKPDVNK